MPDKSCLICAHRIGAANNFACTVHLEFRTRGVPYDCTEFEGMNATPGRARSCAPPQAAHPPATNRGGKVFAAATEKGEKTA